VKGFTVRTAKFKRRSTFHAVLWLLLLFTVAAALASNADDLTEPAWVYKGRGDRSYRNGEVGHAIFEYKKALIKAKADGIIYPEVSLQLAKVYKDEGLYELAIDHIEIVERNRARLQIPDLIYETLYTKAEVFLQIERYNEALGVYEAIIGQDSNWKSYAGTSLYELVSIAIDDDASKGRYAEAYLRIGMLKYMNYNYENAIPALKMAMLYRHKWDQTLKYLLSCYEKVEDSRATEYLMGLMESGEIVESRDRS
jgi:tetratricopeptide (TPR) repeat protein